MKKTKHLLTTAFIAAALLSVNAQSGAKWATGGNGTGTGDIFGTTNSQPINFTTNNVLKMVLDANGNLRLVNFAGTGTRLVTTDANGNLLALPQGTAGQFLSSNGTWQNLPLAATTFSNSGANIYLPASSKFGIGTTAPTVPLEVMGDAKISNNVTVGNKLIFGTGASNVGVKYTPSTPTSPNVLNFGGDLIDSGTPVTWNPCNPLGVIPPTITTFGGLIQTYNVNSSNNYVTGTTIFDIGANVGGAFLNSKFAPLFVNVDCNSDIYLMGTKIGCGTSSPLEKFHFKGGKLRVDDELQIHRNPTNASLRIFDDNSGNIDEVFYVTANGKTVIGFEQNQSANNIALNINSGSFIDAINVNNGSAINFRVGGTGVTQIGLGQSLSPNKLLTVNGDVLFANNGTTAGGHQYDGYSGFEIVGGDRVPDRRGISVEDDPAGNLSFFVNSNQSNGGPQFRFKNGVGTATSASAIPDLFVINYNGTTKINVSGAPSTGATPIIINAFDVFNVADNKSNFIIKSNVQTIIGKPLLNTNTHFGTYSLSVNGKVVCKEIIVTQQSWADYVFANTYKLQSLESLENYINKNKHLPNIPSASEVETNGVNIGEMSKLQMEKIEELTLYVIQLKKELEALKKQVNAK